MHLFSLDTVLYKLYKDKWKLEENQTCMTYTTPRLWKLRFSNYNDQSNNELVLFKFPSHYKHKSLFQYDFGFFLYFGMIGGISLLKGLRDFYKRKFKSGLFFSGFAAFTFLEGVMISRRVKDVKLITLKNGRTLGVKTFQDGEMEYQLDLKDLRVVNKDKESLMVLLDVNMARNKKFLFLFFDPTPGCIYNWELFATVMLDKRYLTYPEKKIEGVVNKL